MFRVLALALTRSSSKTISPLINRLNNEVLLNYTDNVSIKRHFSSSTSIAGFWQTRSCVVLSVTVSTGMVFVKPGPNVNRSSYRDVFRQESVSAHLRARPWNYMWHDARLLHTRHLASEQSWRQYCPLSDTRTWRNAFISNSDGRWT